MSAPEPGPPPGPTFLPCYRHADRMSGISCQRCHRPVCGECMVEASVGFQCPDCARRDRSGTRTPRTRTGAPLSLGSAPLSAYSAAAILVGVKVVVGLADLFSGVQGLLVHSNAAVAQGEVWRLVTHSFTSAGLFNLVISALFLFLICRSIEAEVGRWRIIAAYLLAGFGSACVVFALGPANGFLVGGFTSLLGLLAMNAMLKRRRGDDVRAELIFLGILVVFNLAIGGLGGGPSQLLGILGAAAFGAGVGVVYTSGPREGRSRRQVLGLVGLTAVGALLVAGRMLLALA